MIREDLTSLLLELEEIIEINQDFAISETIFPTFGKIYETLDVLQHELEQYPQQCQQQQLETLVHSIPAAIAILDRQMCYVLVNDRWAEYFQLDRQKIIGRNYYEIFPQIPESWRQSERDCLAGKVGVVTREEEDFAILGDRANGLTNLSSDCLDWKILPWNHCTGEIAGLLISIEVITEKYLLQQKIKSCEARMRSIFACRNELVFTLDRSSNTILFLPTKFFEIHSEQVVNQIVKQTHVQLFDSNDAEGYQNKIAHILQTQTTIEFEYSLQLEDSLIWYSAKVSPTSKTTVIWIAKDITNLKETESNNLLIEQELAQATLQSIGEGVIRTNALGLIQYINPAAEKLTGWQVEEAKGRSLEEVLPIVSQSTKKPVDLVERIRNRHRTYKLTAKNILIARKNRKYAIEGVASEIVDSQDKLCGIVIVFRDVSQARKIAQKLSWQATHDPLTKLYNRRKFEEKVTKAIECANNSSFYYALCYLDLDRFKIVNDSCGHSAGDRLLCQISKLLQQRVRISDVFARVGGDEFALLLHQCSIEQAVETANQLVQIVREFRFIWQDKVFRIGVSVGVVGIDSATEGLTNLLNAADASCYAAKEEGGNTVHVYRQEDLILAKVQTQKQWVEKINLALEDNRFCLYSQKIVAVNKNKEIHHEVLLRLTDESGTLIAPGLFLPTAERYGLMPAIDRWVVATFLSGYEVYLTTRACQNSNSKGNFYTINLSGASINNQEFSGFLQEQFARYNIPPETICFEITETAAITNIEQAVTFINQLKELGCLIALDDFGSGMSSFNYLKHLAVDYLKIDGSFIQNIVSDKVDYATVECFNHISQIMNIKTIAEFVENTAILDNLKEIGVDYAQGYGIEMPQPLIWV